MALRLRVAEPWLILDDTMVFGVKLPDEEIAYCCVMGNNGEHYGLAVYVGTLGLTHFINQLRGSALGYVSPLAIRSINCDFEKASDTNLSKTEKEEVRRIAKESGIGLKRSQGYPEFICYDGGRVMEELDERSSDQLYAAMRATVTLSDMIREMTEFELKLRGFDRSDTYPYPWGGKLIPLLNPRPDGGYDWTTMRTPAALAPSEIAMPLSEAARKELDPLPRLGVYECRAVSLPAPLNIEGGVLYPPMLMVIERLSGMIMPIKFTDNGGDKGLADLLDNYVEALHERGSLPAQIVVDDPLTERVLADLCRQLGIRLEKVDELPNLDDAFDFMVREFMSH